jgi:hypothetical protein
MSESKKQQAIRVYRELIDKLKRHITLKDLEHAGISRHTVRNHFESLTKLEEQAIVKAKPTPVAEIPVQEDKKAVSYTDKQQEIVDKYIELYQQLKRKITLNDLHDNGIPKYHLENHFQSLSRLTQCIRQTHPDTFVDVHIRDILDPQTTQELQNIVKKCKRFLITTAVTNCQVDAQFLASLENYCAKNDAAILVVIASDPASKADGKYGTIDKRILSSAHAFPVIENIALNSNIHISTIKLSAKHIDPLTGLARLSQRNGSFVYASPKQRLKSIPVSNVKLPHVIMTTGAITNADYDTYYYHSDRTAVIADNDHIIFY